LHRLAAVLPHDIGGLAILGFPCDEVIAVQQVFVLYQKPHSGGQRHVSECLACCQFQIVGRICFGNCRLRRRNLLSGRLLGRFIRWIAVLEGAEYITAFGRGHQTVYHHGVITFHERFLPMHRCELAIGIRGEKNGLKLNAVPRLQRLFAVFGGNDAAPGIQAFRQDDFPVLAAAGSIPAAGHLTVKSRATCRIHDRCRQRSGNFPGIFCPKTVCDPGRAGD